MHISGLRVRITIQRNETVTDNVGNHTSQWTDTFTCWATAASSGRSAEETENAGHTQAGDRLDVTVRWCAETAAVTSKTHRILLDGRVYNIVGIDEMGFGRRSRKYQCVLEARA